MCMLIRGAADRLSLMKIRCVQWKRRFKRTDDSPFRYFPCIFHKFHDQFFMKLCLINFVFGNCVHSGCRRCLRVNTKLNKLRDMLSRGVVMFNGTARPHTDAATQDLIATFGWEIRSSPLQPRVSAKWFTCLPASQNVPVAGRSTTTTRFASQAASFYDAGTEKLVPRYDRCLKNGGNYVEKLRRACTSNCVNRLEIKTFLIADRNLLSGQPTYLAIGNIAIYSQEDKQPRECKSVFSVSIIHFVSYLCQYLIWFFKSETKCWKTCNLRTGFEVAISAYKKLSAKKKYRRVCRISVAVTMYRVCQMQ
jgi:hypothetical protein